MIISIFKSISKAYVDLHVDLPWEDIADLLTEHHDADSKYDVEMFNMAEFKPLTDPTVQHARRYHGEEVNGEWHRNLAGTYDEIPDTVRRCKANLLSISGIILDIDEKMTLEETITQLAGLEYVIYTTFRHTADKNKFRVVIPFKRPLLASDIAGRQESIIETFPGVDNCSFTMSQSFYLHSGKNDPIAYHNKGVILDPYDDFEYREQAVVVVDEQVVSKMLTDAEADAYRKSVINSLMSCRGLHYAGGGANKHGILTLISICRSIGLEYNEFDAICSAICSPESALTGQQPRREAWASWKGTLVRAATRDKFIECYGGIPIRKPKQNYKEVQNNLIEKYTKGKVNG